MKRNILLVLVVTCLAGCGDMGDPALPALPELAERQRVAINEMLVANHPHFTEGRSRAPSLNADAFDFMIGRPKSDFSSVFDLAGDSITPADAELRFPGHRIDEWINNRLTDTTEELSHFVFDTAIGRTFGFDAQLDYLIIETCNDKITGWQLFSITNY